MDAISQYGDYDISNLADLQKNMRMYILQIIKGLLQCRVGVKAQTKNHTSKEAFLCLEIVSQAASFSDYIYTWEKLRYKVWIGDCVR